MKSSKINVTYMVELAVLIAIIIIMAFTPLGYIKTLGLEITLIVVPVCVGAVTLGPLAGLILGTVFGVTAYIQCFIAPNALVLGTTASLTADGHSLGYVYALFFLMCIPTRMLMGYLTGVIFLALKKAVSKDAIATPIACIAGPILNTILFMSTLCICFYNTDFIQGLAKDLGATNVFLFVILLVGINGLVETIATFILGTAISIPVAKLIRSAKTA